MTNPDNKKETSLEEINTELKEVNLALKKENKALLLQIKNLKKGGVAKNSTPRKSFNAVTVNDLKL